MLALAIKTQRLVAQQKPLPRLRNGWALLQPRLAGICNTDIELLRGYHAFRGTPGHEFVADVVAVQGTSAQKSKWIGQRVTGDINVTCVAYGFKPLCALCRRGQPTHCLRRTVLGIVKLNGAFAEFFALPLVNLHVVPKTVSDQQAVFVEPLAAACRILEQIAIKDFSSVAVIGDGKLANLIAQVLRTASPNITVFGKHTEKLKLLLKRNVKTQIVRGDASDLSRIKPRFPFVVEASGSASGLALAQLITEPLGTIILKSTFHGPASVELWPIVVNELRVLGSRCGPFEKAIAMLRTGKVDVTSLITRSFPLSQAQAAIEFAQQPGVMKVLLHRD